MERFPANIKEIEWWEQRRCQPADGSAGCRGGLGCSQPDAPPAAGREL